MTTPLNRRRAFLLALSCLLAALLAVFLYLGKQAPPVAARLLPESDAIVYLNLRPLRAATHFDQHPTPHDPGYQRFIDKTGIDFERDLNEAAFALTRTADPLGPNGPVAYSEVFSGSFDAKRLADYLASVSFASDTYAGHTIYSISSDNRTVRVALLGSDRVAVSNTPTPEQIHSILDHARTASWLPFSGPWLLSEHYRDVPLLSAAWGLGELALPFTDHGKVRIMGLSLPWQLDSTLIASIRWTGALNLRVEQIAPGDAAAATSAAALSNLIKVGRMAEDNLPGSLSDPNLRALLDSATVGHEGNRAIVTASLPTHLMDSLLQSPTAPSGH